MPDVSKSRLDATAAATVTICFRKLTLSTTSTNSMASTRFDELPRALADGGVEFVLVGMLAGVLRGAPLTTRDGKT
jgi:hypothetical protein